jgi:hypothetical protein
MILSKFLCIIVAFIYFGFFSTTTVTAEEVGAAKVYIAQFVELHTKVEQIMKNITQVKNKQDLREEMFALVKIIHRLDEESARTNLDMLKRGQASDKKLLLVSQGCEALEFVTSALDNFLDTGDRAFLGFAKNGNNLVNSVKKIL